MQEQNSKEKLKIPLTITTEFDEPDSDFETRQLQSDYASRYASSIVYFVKMAVRGHDIIKYAADSEPLLELQPLTGNLHTVCEVLEGLLAQVEGPSVAAAEMSSVAQVLASLFKSQDTPEPLKVLLEAALTDFANKYSSSGQESHRLSIRGIEAILSDYTAEEGFRK